MRAALRHKLLALLLDNLSAEELRDVVAILDDVVLVNVVLGTLDDHAEACLESREEAS